MKKFGYIYGKHLISSSLRYMANFHLRCLLIFALAMPFGGVVQARTALIKRSVTTGDSPADTILRTQTEMVIDLSTAIFNLMKQREPDDEFIVICANRAYAIDSNAYYGYSPVYDIAGFRLNIDDIKGAMRDLNYLLKLDAAKPRSLQDPVGIKERLAQAYLRLERPEPAAMLYAHVGLPRTFGKLLKINYDYHDKALYNRSIKIVMRENDEALKYHDTDRYDQRTKAFYPKGQYPSIMLMDYAYILLMMNKPQEALKIFSKPHRPERYGQDLLAAKDLISAMCQYMLHPGSFDEVKTTLTKAIADHGKIAYHWYIPLDQWLPYSDISKESQERLMELESIAK